MQKSSSSEESKPPTPATLASLDYIQMNKSAISRGVTTAQGLIIDRSHHEMRQRYAAGTRSASITAASIPDIVFGRPTQYAPETPSTDKTTDLQITWVP